MNQVPIWQNQQRFMQPMNQRDPFRQSNNSYHNMHQQHQQPMSQLNSQQNNQIKPQQKIINNNQQIRQEESKKTEATLLNQSEKMESLQQQLGQMKDKLQETDKCFNDIFKKYELEAQTSSMELKNKQDLKQQNELLLCELEAMKYKNTSHEILINEKQIITSKMERQEHELQSKEKKIKEIQVKLFIQETLELQQQQNNNLKQQKDGLQAIVEKQTVIMQQMNHLKIENSELKFENEELRQQSNSPNSVHKQKNYQKMYKLLNEEQKNSSQRSSVQASPRVVDRDLYPILSSQTDPSFHIDKAQNLNPEISSIHDVGEMHRLSQFKTSQAFEF